MKGRRIDGLGYMGDSRPDKPGDDDRGERSYERGARDDSGESHVWDNLTPGWLAVGWRGVLLRHVTALASA